MLTSPAPETRISVRIPGKSGQNDRERFSTDQSSNIVGLRQVGPSVANEIVSFDSLLLS